MVCIIYNSCFISIFLLNLLFMKENQVRNLPRPPIVVVLGHVDHGKSSLLDFIRKTNIVAKEAGGITQSIGAYEIIHNNKRITFIDTPGHEAFSKMRIRGAKIADLAILVIAADDSVQPQTKESIEILNSSKTPFVVAINKIDKPNADIDKTKNDLMANNVFLEGYGGNISYQPISAKTGQGINELLDLILLAVELENLTYNPNVNAEGIILETKTDSRRGAIVTAIIKNGTLKKGSKIATQTAIGKIKTLESFDGQKTETLSPSSPALIFGFESLPQIGEDFFTEKRAEEIYKQAIERPGVKAISQEPTEKISINLIIKADVSGSLETLSGIIKNIKHGDIKINIIDELIGEISDGDVKKAASSNALILGFKIKVNRIAESLAKAQDVKIITSEIIYELTDFIEKEIKLKQKPLPLAEFEVIKIFSQKGKKQLIGGKVISGTIKTNARLKIIRENNEIGFGKITGLKQHKKDVNQVLVNEECGIMFESDTTVNEKDVLIWQNQ